MIKISNNLVKLAEKASDKAKDKKKGRKVDYKGRALKGGIVGALTGALGGGGIGAIIGQHNAIQNNLATNKKNPFDLTFSDYGTDLLLGAGGGALLGGGVGALGHMLSGYANEDIITRQDEPNRRRRGWLSSIIPGLYYGGVGGLLGGALDHHAKSDVPWRGVTGALLGAAAGGGIGALGGAYVGPWMNADYYGQEEGTKE